MHVIICHIPIVQTELLTGFPFLFETVNYYCNESIIRNILLVNEKCTSIFQQGRIPIISSYQEIGPPIRCTKYMITFDSTEQLRKLLLNNYDDEALIEEMVKIYKHDKRHFSRDVKQIKYNLMEDYIMYTIVPTTGAVRVCCGSLFKTGTKQLFLNIYERNYGVKYHGDMDRDLSRKIGVIFSEDSGEIISPAVHLGNGYFVTKLFAAKNDCWSFSPILLFNDYKYKLGSFNYDSRLSEDNSGITVIRLFDAFDSSTTCKVAKQQADIGGMKLMFTGMNASDDIVTVRKDVCRLDVAWYHVMVLVNRNNEILGFADSVKSYYLSDAFKFKLNRHVSSLSMMAKNVLKHNAREL